MIVHACKHLIMIFRAFACGIGDYGARLWRGRHGFIGRGASPEYKHYSTVLGVFDDLEVFLPGIQCLSMPNMLSSHNKYRYIRRIPLVHTPHSKMNA